MAGTIIKLQTNIPISGMVTYCDFIPTSNPQYSDQIAVRGEWDGFGPGRIYLPLPLERDFQSLGLIGQRAQNGNYPLLIAQARIKLLRVEQGNTKRTTVELLSGSASQATQPASTPPALYGAGTATTPPAYANPNRTDAPKPVSVEDLEETLNECLAASKEIWEQAGGNVNTNTDAIAATAHTLFISRCQRGLYAKAEVEGVPFA